MRLKSEYFTRLFSRMHSHRGRMGTS